eukprot:g14389.t1
MVKTWHGWVLLSPLELLAVEAMGGVTLASVVGRAASAMGGVASAVAVGGVASALVVGGAASAVGGAGGISSGVDGIRCPGSGIPSGRGCDVIRGCPDSDHVANGGGHIVGKVLCTAGDLGGGGSPFWVVGT